MLGALSPTLGTSFDTVRIDQRPIAAGDPIPNILGTGYEEFHLLEPGFLVQVTNGTAVHDWMLSASGSQDALRLRIIFDGQALYTGQGSSVQDEKSRCTFLVQHAGANLTAVYRRGSAYRYCTLDVSRDFLSSRLGLQGADLPKMLAQHWRRHETAFGHIPLDRNALATASRLFNLESDGALRLVEVKALALELLRQLFTSWQNAGVAAPASMRLRPSERAAILAIGRQVQQTCPQVVTLAEAVKMSKINRNKIQQGFRQMFGMSLQQYCTDMRMQMARHLLQTTKLPIANIAEKCGFSEPTNFTAAFRKHFSVTPSAVRRLCTRSRGQNELHLERPVA